MSQSKSKEYNKYFQSSGFFVFRTPLLPFSELTKWGEDLEACAALVDEDESKLQLALNADRKLLRDRLKTLIELPEVREAIFVASPSLDSSLEQWFKDPDSERGQKVERALVRYFVRMAGRPTPFGLFSGCSLGRMDEETSLVTEDRHQYRRHTRLDMDYLTTLCEALGRQPELKKSLTYYPNSSVYTAAGRIRYVETKMAETGRTHNLVAVDWTDYLEATLQQAEKGATLAELAQSLVDNDQDITLLEAQEYIEELIDAQLLVSDLSPLLTGTEPVHDLVDLLKQYPDMSGTVDILDQARQELAEIDGNGLRNEPQRYQDIANRLEELPSKVDLSKLYQVDMIKPAPSATLGQKPMDVIKLGTFLLYRIFGPRSRDRLTSFSTTFFSRYEDQEVPLIQVLDEEVGIGFERSTAPTSEASPLLAGLNFPTINQAEDQTVPWGSIYGLMLRKLGEAREKGADEIVLEQRELEEIPGRARVPMPDSFSSLVTICSSSEEALNKGDFDVIFAGASGPTGANLLGRFCFADDNIHKAVERHLREEEALQPEAIFAEIVHLPEGRIGNILARPVLREYEIAYLGRSGASKEFIIPITDLYVSVIGGPMGGQVVLRSARLNREIIPRMTTAHNIVYPTNTGIYKFLTAMQRQSGFRWDWGVFESEPYLPRVRCGQMVFSRARWLITADEIKEIEKHDGAAQFREIQKWRERRKLPRWVLVADSDNELPVDLDNILGSETVMQLIHNRSYVNLVEMYPTADNLCARGPEGPFVHEIVVPFVRNREASPSNFTKDYSPVESKLRRFVPGSEWLYAKLYTGTSTADQVLRELVAPVADESMQSGLCDQWFFIRYGDPDWHVRVRFHGDPHVLSGQVLPKLQVAAAPLLQNNQLRKVVLDTYERELERYGSEVGIHLFEHFSHVDSQAVMEIVKLISGDEGADARWRLALRGIDQLLDDLGLDAEGKQKVMSSCRENYGREYAADVTDLKNQLGTNFRTERKNIETLLDPSKDEASQLWPGLNILRWRSEALVPIVKELHEQVQAGRLPMTIQNLAPSYIHMHANRMLRSSARAQELVIYDFLLRIYKSREARARKAGQTKLHRKIELKKPEEND